MRHKKGDDPRWVLCESKYFTLRPQPLEEYLWALDLPRIAERVFWVHWQEGHRRGDWTSEIAISQVAARCHCDESSVTRAYQALRRHGLIRRQSTGRHPENPFREGIAVSEVLLPRNEIGQLMAAPSRRKVESAKAPAQQAESAIPAAPATVPVEPRKPSEVEERYGRHAMRIVAEKFTTEEQQCWNTAMRAAQTGQPGAFTASPGSKLDGPECSYLQGVLDRLFQVTLEERRALHASHQAARNTAPASPRLSPFDLAYLRHQLSAFLAEDALVERFREISWSVEFGALQRFAIRHALNIAVKKCRTKTWTRPNKMPPNWRRNAA